MGKRNLWSRTGYRGMTGIVFLRHKNNKKWFALVVESQCKKKLGLQEDKTVDVLNIKCDPMMIGSLRMKEGFFPPPTT